MRDCLSFNLFSHTFSYLYTFVFVYREEEENKQDYALCDKRFGNFLVFIWKLTSLTHLLYVYKYDETKFNIIS